jgi:hypothetical protein
MEYPMFPHATLFKCLIIDAWSIPEIPNKYTGRDYWNWFVLYLHNFLQHLPVRTHHILHEPSSNELERVSPKPFTSSFQGNSSPIFTG